MFNWRLIEAMDWFTGIEVDIRTVTTDSREISDGRNDAGYDIVLVDSSLIGMVTPPKASRAGWFLLVHDLTLCNPTAYKVDTRRSERIAISKYEGIIAVTQYTKLCLEKLGVATERIHVSGLGLDPIFRVEKRPPTQSADTCKILTIVHLATGMGLLEFVDILEGLEDLSWTWHIVGEGRLDPLYAEALTVRVASSPVSNRIVWEESADEDELPTLYREHDLFVLPARFMAFSMAVRESMACALPVVTYDVGGIAESVALAGGVLVPSYDDAMMCKTLRTLIASSVDRYDLAERAQQSSMQFPEWKHVAEGLLAYWGVRIAA